MLAAVSEVGRRVRGALPAVGLLTLATAAMLGVSTLLGFAPAPAAWRIALTLVAAGLLGIAAADQVRAALTDWQGATAAESGVHRRPRRGLIDLAGELSGERTGDWTGDRVLAGRLGDEERTETGIFTGRTRRVPTTGDLWGEPDEPPSRSERPEPPARGRPPRPSWMRIAVTTLIAAALAALLWVPQVPVSGVARTAAQFVVGYGAFALPVLPLLLAWPLPRLRRGPRWSWRLPLLPVADRRLWTGAELRELAVTTLAFLRERVLTRASGIVLATLGLLHLVRGNPNLLDGGTNRAGGLAGFLLAEPLRLLLASGGAIALLGGVLAGAAAVIAASVGRAWGTVTGYSVLAVALVVPLGLAGASHWLGYEYYLRTQDGRVVVVAGLSPRHVQSVHDTSLRVDGMSPSLVALLDKGLPVTGNDDGERIAKALAQPGTSAAELYVGDQFELKSGECFDWIGGSSQLRYVAPCNGAHVGEVTFVGHLPFTVDPGKSAVDAAAKAMCEQSYGDYLGVPFGQSFLPLEAPLLPPALEEGWHARPVIACWLGSVGPWTLKGTRTVAALQQKTPWGAAGGCKIEVPDALRVTAAQPGVRCLAPGPEQRLSVPGGGFAMDLEFAAIGKAAGGAKVGAGCFDGANLTNGYSFEVAPDGVIEIWKHFADQHARLTASAKPKNAGPPTTASTPLQVTCKPTPDGGVELTAFSTGSRKASVVDKNAPITSLSPRLVLANAEAGGVVMTTMIFNATRV
ncbi:hypothetical protein ACFFX1_04535 [Dactylosporangium sucinum]|uniref:Uncharacterized protein n=1 Tax=Dactylosporangium sucinum TaxID=1424081 RepID=A0A917X347_9ACTN|nr:hypothetical protein [Dactylosporangium sucinum]GGM59853.1 hypothetical protein GCM10007977_071720 [Dactylosporangium sucinum]